MDIDRQPGRQINTARHKATSPGRRSTTAPTQTVLSVEGKRTATGHIDAYRERRPPTPSPIKRPSATTCALVAARALAPRPAALHLLPLRRQLAKLPSSRRPNRPNCCARRRARARAPRPPAPCQPLSATPGARQLDAGLVRDHLQQERGVLRDVGYLR